MARLKNLKRKIQKQMVPFNYHWTKIYASLKSSPPFPIYSNTLGYK